MNGTTMPHDWFPRPLPANCSIGAGSWLYSSFAFLHCRSTRREAAHIGRDTGIYHGTFFDLGSMGEVHIGDYCTVVGAIFCTNYQIEIGNFVFISHEVVIADHETGTPMMETTDNEKHRRKIVIGNDVWIGAQAIVLGGVRVGAGSIIGAAALVDRDVPEYSIFAGNPGRVVGSVGPHTAGWQAQPRRSP